MTNAEPLRILIVGLGTGGLYSAKKAMGFNRRAEITIIERRPYDMFSPCGLPFAVEGRVESFESLKHDVPDFMKRMNKKLMHEVQTIYPDEKVLEVKNLDNWDVKNIEYDSLILATGSSPFMLPVEGAEEMLGRGVHFVSTIENSIEVQNAAKKAKNAVIIGGGPIGLEIAYALLKLGVSVSITKKSEPIFPKILDKDIGEMIREYLTTLDFDLHFGKKTERINTDDKGNIESVTIGGKEIPADFVVMGAGSKPNTELAVDAGLAIGETGGIKVDDHMRTSDPAIYALGDCIESFNLIDNKPLLSQLATSAYLQGRAAGVNAAGGDETYRGDLNTFVTVIGDLEIAAVGYNSTEAQAAGFQVVTSKGKGWNISDYIPGATQVTVKLITDKSTGKIIGGQAVSENGGGGAAWRVNMISMAIRTGLTCDQLAENELAYTPPVSQVYDPLSMAAEFGIKKLKQSR